MQGPRRLRYCVDNEWLESRTTKPYMPVTDSSTGEVIAEAPCCTVDEVNSAVAAAKAAFPGWSTTPVQQPDGGDVPFPRASGGPSGGADPVGLHGTGQEPG